MSANISVFIDLVFYCYLGHYDYYLQYEYIIYYHCSSYAITTDATTENAK